MSAVKTEQQMVHYSPQPKFSLAPRTLAEAKEFSAMIAASDFAPASYKRKPAECLIAIAMGADLGLSPMQSLQNITVINGRPSVWGDAMLAICRAHKDFEDFKEYIEGSGDNRVAHCMVKRRNQTPITVSFSVQNAKEAKLWGKTGPWTQYADRMLKLRARGFALRDAFADALCGIISTEEAMDMPRGDLRVVSIQPLPHNLDTGEVIESAPITEEYVSAVSKINECETIADLKAFGVLLKTAKFTDEALRALYKNRLAILQTKFNVPPAGVSTFGFKAPPPPLEPDPTNELTADDLKGFSREEIAEIEAANGNSAEE